MFALCEHSRMTAAKLIAKARKAKGWTPAEFAREMGVSRSTVHAWEHGGAGPKRDRLREIAEKLELDVLELLG